MTTIFASDESCKIKVYPAVASLALSVFGVMVSVIPAVEKVNEDAGSCNTGILVVALGNVTNLYRMI